MAYGERPRSAGSSTVVVATEPALAEPVRLLDAVPSPAVLLDDDGTYVHANPAAVTLFGRPLDQILGSRIGENGADPEAAREAWRTLRETGRSEGRIHGTRLDGSTLWAHYRLVGDALPGLHLGLFSDVTDQVDAESARSDLAAIVRASVDAIVGLDLAAVVRSWNPAAERLYGYTEQEAVGSRIVDLIVPADQGDEARAHFTTVALGAAVAGQDAVRRRKDGSLVHVSLSLAPVVDASGRVVGISMIHRDAGERIRAQAALAESERNLRLMAENSRDAFFVYDMDRRLRYANASIEDLYGYTPEEVRSGFIQWGHPDERDRIRRLWDGLFQGQGFAEEEYRVVARDGTQKWVAGTWGPMLDEDGRQVGVQGVDRDITDRKRAEDALRRTAERYRTLVEQLPAMTYISTVEPQGMIFVSSQAEALTGFGQDRWLHDHDLWRRQLHDEDRDRAVEAWERFLAERSTFAEEYRFVAGDGTVRWFQDVAVVLEDAHGHTGQIQGIIVDVTSQRRLDDRLRESERRMRQMLEGIELVAVTTDLLGRISSVNAHLLRVTGYAEDELIDRNWDELFVPDDDEHRTEWRDFLAELAAGRVPPKGSGVLITRDGELRSVEWVNTELRDHAGKVAGLISLGMDVTEQRAAQEALAESVTVLRRSMRERQLLLSRLQGAQEEERRRIAADIHDDSIQVMAATAMRLSMLRRRMPEDGPVEAVAQIEDIVQQAMARLRHLVFELLPTALDREGLAAALRMYLGVMREETGISFHIDDGLVDEPDTELRTALYRVAQEALTNVRKHARATTVDVTVRERGGGIVVRITDDGRGFEPDDAHRPTPGHLGLSAMRERTEALGGWCSIDSAPGRGTTVELWVPRSPWAASGS